MGIVIKLQSFVHISESSILVIIASFTQWKEEIEIKYEETFVIRKLVPKFRCRKKVEDCLSTRIKGLYLNHTYIWKMWREI